MLRDKPVSHLILVLFISLIAANVAGEAMRAIIHFLSGTDTIVERALLQYLSWSVGPITLNLVILTFSFDLSLRFNLITVVGMFIGWYYLKHTY
jgi:hypothetical protein